MTTNEFRAVIFDLDDTLYPETAFIESGFRVVAEWVAGKWPYDAREVARSFKQLYQSGVRGNTFQVWLATAVEISADIEAEMVRVYRTHTPRIAPFPDAAALLQELQRHYGLGLVSDGILAVQRNKLDVLQLAPYFREIVFSDELGREHWKPSPRPFETILERLNVAPTQAVYVGDNVVKDFVAPRRLGMGTIQVKRSNGVYAHLQPASDVHAPHCVVTELRQVVDVLRDFPQLAGEKRVP